MDWIAELFRRSSVWVVRAEVFVAGLISIRAPVTLVFAGLGVIHNHAVVPVAVRDVRFVFLFVDGNLGRASQILRVVAALALARLSDLKEESSGLRQLQDHRVVGQPKRNPGSAVVSSLLSGSGCCGRR